MEYLSDKQLIEKSLQNGEDFGLLIDRYEQKIHRYICRISSANNEDRKDLLQEIFIKAYTKLANFDKSLSFNSWIYRIAHNSVRDWARKHNRRKDSGFIHLDDEFIVEFIKDSSFEYKQEQDTLKHIIENIFQKMSAEKQEILVLKYLEGKSYAEISDILQKPESTIGTQAARAKKEFKKIYETITT